MKSTECWLGIPSSFIAPLIAQRNRMKLFQLSKFCDTVEEKIKNVESKLEVQFNSCFNDMGTVMKVAEGDLVESNHLLGLMHKRFERPA